MIENLTTVYNGKLITEEWKNIHGYDDLYKISSFGRLKSYHESTQKIISLSLTGSGYYKATICKDGEYRYIMIHRIVGELFCGFTNLKNVIDHIDNDKLNNMWFNLQSITQRENSSKDKYRYNSSSKYVGVWWSKSKNRWSASIVMNKKQYCLGYFRNELDAKNKYDLALNDYESGLSVNLILSRGVKQKRIIGSIAKHKKNRFRLDASINGCRVCFGTYATREDAEEMKEYINNALIAW